MPLGGLCPLPLPLGGDAATGWTAEQHARLCADLVACSRTLPFAVVYFQSAGILDYLGMNGVGAAYAPTAVYNGVGDYTLTWQPSYEDAYGNAEPVALHHGEVSPRGVLPYLGTAELVAPNVVRVRVYHVPSAAPTNTACVLVVW
jgi:hypothetical protein